MIRSRVFASCRKSTEGFGNRFRSFLSSQSYCSSPDNEAEIDRIKAELRLFDGGSVDFLSGDDFAVIKLNHPARRNAMSGRMMAELNDIASELNNSKQFKSVAFTAEENENGLFCSGGDLNTIKNIPSGHDMSKLMHDTAIKFRTLSIPSVCFINGRAIGGGAEMTLFTDFRVFSEKGSLAFVQAKMGLTTGWGGGKLLVDLVGRKRALELLLSNRKINCNEATDLGLCDANLPSLEEAIKWMDPMIRKHDFEVIEAAKKVCQNAADHSSLTSALNEEAKIFSTIFRGPANKKANESNIKH